MSASTDALSKLLRELRRYLDAAPESALAHRPAPGKWPRREIVGHLVDSAVHNPARFTEAQAGAEPYRIRPYPQDDLVAAGRYQDRPTGELLALLEALNTQITHVTRDLPAGTLDRCAVLPDGSPADLAFLVDDYVAHLRHHVAQVTATA